MNYLDAEKVGYLSDINNVYLFPMYAKEHGKELTKNYYSVDSEILLTIIVAVNTYGYAHIIDEKID